MIELKVRKIGNSLGVVLSKESIQQLKVCMYVYCVALSQVEGMVGR
jgi:hypothetical protein